MDRNNINVSVILPTLNAGMGFEVLLQTLIKQKEIDKLEIVVVDSGSIDETLSIARRYEANTVTIEPSKFSHSYARNVGAEIANHEFILFMTQDALPSSERWLIKMLEPIINDKAIVAVSCGEQPRANADLFALSSIWAHARFMEIDNADKIMEFPKDVTYSNIKKNANISDVACLYVKEVFLKFKYRFNYAEDLDMGNRLITAGYKMYLQGNNRVIHSHCRDSFYYLRRMLAERATFPLIFSNEPTTNFEEEEVYLASNWIYNQTLEWINQIQQISLCQSKNEIIFEIEKICSHINDKINLDKIHILPDENFIKYIEEINCHIDKIGKKNLSQEVKLTYFNSFNQQFLINTAYIFNFYEEFTFKLLGMLCDSMYCICANIIGYFWGNLVVSASINSLDMKKIYDNLNKGV